MCMGGGHILDVESYLIYKIYYLIRQIFEEANESQKISLLGGEINLIRWNSKILPITYECNP